MAGYKYSKSALQVLERSVIPFVVFQRLAGRIVPLVISAGFCDLFALTREEAAALLNRDMYVNVHPDDKDRLLAEVNRFVSEGGSLNIVYRLKTEKRKDDMIVHLQGERLLAEDGTRLTIVWFTSEGFYSAKNEDHNGLARSFNALLREETMIRRASYDGLTGLPNMANFFKLADAARSWKNALVYCDFCGLTGFNRKNGYAEGDNLIHAFAELLVKYFGIESCCRLAQDNFAIYTDADGLEAKLEKLFEDCHSLNGGKSLPVRAGIYVDDNPELEIGVACDRAKMACNVHRNSYVSVYEYFTEKLQEKDAIRQYILDNLDRAMQEKWIQAYLQPIIRAVNEKVCDVEALARWVDPERGVLSPASFIPVLEDAGLIYKLDLYMVDRVLEIIKMQLDAGFNVIPHSINLSRSDFDACDIVEEIRKRVDASGIDRNKITIEITESVIGNDLVFMKEQVNRFRELGFPVWMDDFGSGYSSMDVLQSIQFDLIKFDMSFMQKYDEGGNAKVILTELMRMATSLGVDTVCEGVETASQVRFLQEIGCSKLQGYYYSKPISLKTFMEMDKKSTLIENENPDESDYYENIGRVNLFDLGVIASGDDNALQHSFNMVPIAILEINGDKARYLRSNRSYQFFAKRFFNYEITNNPFDLKNPEGAKWSNYISEIKRCCKSGNSIFFDGKVSDGSVSHFLARRIHVNPVTGATAVAMAVLSISEPDGNTTYADIARSLAADYYNLFVIDLDTNSFTEYSSKVGDEELSIVRHGEDFFASARRDTMTRIYEEDREPFLALFTKEKVLRDLDRQGVFTTTYRLIDTGTPMYVNMKITRLRGGNRLILGISIIDAHMKQMEEDKKLRQERVSLGRIAALSPDYIVLYTIDPVTGHYTQYNASKEFKSFGLAKQGDDFFADVVLDAPKAIAPEDMERHLRVFTKENVLRGIRENGLFVHHYRMIMDGKTVPSSLKATLIRENDGEKIILGVTNDEEEYRRKLEKAYKKANSTAVIYNHVAHALARGYTDLFYVNMDTDEFIEFHTDDERGVLNEARRGTEFFEECKREAKLYVHQEDQAAFVKAMNRRFLEEILTGNKVFELTYRRIKGGEPFYVLMKVSRMEDDKRFIVIAVQDIDELMRQRRAEEQREEERIIYTRLHALTGNYICIYVVDPETGSYREFSATANYEESLKQAKEGSDFFTTVREAARTFNHPEDQKRFLSAFTKENILAEVKRSGIFTLVYRLMMDKKPVYVQLKAAMVEEKEGPRLIVGIYDIDAQVKQEEEFGKQLAQAQTQATIDALTGIKNKYAYLAAEARLNSQIAEHNQPPFAIVILDVNDLKKVNDTVGHQAGDQYLRDACKIICETFKRSPVFRMGGDEFAVIAQGSDYERIEELVGCVSDRNAEAAGTGGIVIACGMSKFDNDACVAAVFDRADHTMYENKSRLKNLPSKTGSKAGL